MICLFLKNLLGDVVIILRGTWSYRGLFACYPYLLHHIALINRNIKMKITILIEMYATILKIHLYDIEVKIDSYSDKTGNCFLVMYCIYQSEILKLI